MAPCLSANMLQVDVTFTGAATEVKEEKCWTSDVRFTAPNGTHSRAAVLLRNFQQRLSAARSLVPMSQCYKSKLA